MTPRRRPLWLVLSALSLCSATAVAGSGQGNAPQASEPDAQEGAAELDVPAEPEAVELDCRHRPACGVDGRCRLEDGECKATRAEDCVLSERCASQGHCDLHHGECVARRLASCEQSAACELEGRCVARDGECVKRRLDAPRRDPVNAECRMDDDCRDVGLCTKIGRRCVAASVEDCSSSRLCRERGRCTPLDGRCVATTVEQCVASSNCALGGDCYLNAEKHECDDDKVRTNGGLMAAGIVVASLGGVAVIAGMMVAINSHGDESKSVAGYTVMGIGGAVALAAGMPMAIVGGRKVPREGEKQSAMPEVRVSPTGGSLTWSF